jgi:hypothetical protein
VHNFFMRHFFFASLQRAWTRVQMGQVELSKKRTTYHLRNVVKVDIRYKGVFGF